MTSDNRMTWDIILEVFDVLERHGYHESDNQRTCQAGRVIRDLAHVYEGTRDALYGTYLDQAPPSPHPEPRRPVRQADTDAVILTATDVSTVLAALDVAADYKRDRAEMCADCPDQSCPACQTRLHDAQAYDQMAGQMLQSAEAVQAARHGQAEPAAPPRPAHPGSQPTRRPANDHPRQDTGRTRNPPRGRRSPCPRPAAGGQGHA